jgi:hypothetical protein
MSTEVCLRTLATIKESRRIGEVVSGYEELFCATVELAAIRFGLSGETGIYGEIPAAEAIAVLANIFHRDMANDQKIMSAARALALAKEFVACFPHEATRFYTNGTFGRKQLARSWSPATDATVDSGLLVLSRSVTACLWLKDED